MSGAPSVTSRGLARFAPHADWFVTGTVAGFHCTRVWAVAERVVDLLQVLSLQLDDVVDLDMRDVRTQRRWEGTMLPLADVREVMGRLRLPLAAFGGVELTVYTGEDQLTLTPELLLVIYGRTTRWNFLLDAHGLEERAALPPAQWSPSSSALAPAPQLLAALEASAARLQLLEVTA